MEAVEVDRQKRAIEREFLNACSDGNLELTLAIDDANPDLHLLDKKINGGFDEI